jgi:uncharacterized protein (DUF1499 family)
MNILTTVALGLLIIIAVTCAVFLGVGSDRFWRFFGEPDLGPVPFEQIVRRSTANDALVCPLDICKAKSDIAAPLYPVSAAELRRALAKVIASEPRIKTVETSDATLTDRYIQRSERLGFPDTIVARAIDRPDGRSTIALYSRSQLGESDLGVNKARIERWLAKLATHVAPVP